MFHLIALAFLIVCTLPVLYLPMAPELGWTLVMHDVARRRVRWGRDFHFTYGPLAYLALPVAGHHQRSGTLFRLACWSVYWTVCWEVMWQIPSSLVPSFVLLQVACGQTQRATAAYAEPSRVLLASCLGLLLSGHPMAASWLAGFLLLIKFNSGIAAIAAVILIAPWTCWGDVLCGSFLGFCLAGAGDADDFILWLRSSRRQSSCYSDQMTGGHIGRWIVTLSLAPALLIAILLPFCGVRVGLALLMVWFLLWKSALVRFDREHWYPVVQTGLGIAACLIPTAYWPISALAFVFICFPIIRFHLTLPRWTHPAPYRASVESDAFPDSYDPLYAGQSLVQCVPHPAPQSYQAYLPELDAANADHFRSPGAANTVTYGLSGNDLHGFLACPQTHQALWTHYEPSGIVNDPYVVLKKRGEPLRTSIEPDHPFYCGLGDILVLNHQDRYLYRIDFQLTLRGRIESLFWRVFPPHIDVQWVDGATCRFRLNWRNLGGGHVSLQHLPRNPYETVQWWSGCRESAGKVWRVCFNADRRHFHPIFTMNRMILHEIPAPIDLVPANGDAA